MNVFQPDWPHVHSGSEVVGSTQSLHSVELNSIFSIPTPVDSAAYAPYSDPVDLVWTWFPGPLTELGVSVPMTQRFSGHPTRDCIIFWTWPRL